MIKKIIPFLILLFIPAIVLAGFWDNLIGKVEIPVRFGASIMHEIYGGTGESHYDAGDMLISTSTNDLGRLAAGSEGNVLKITGGLPVWGAGTGGSNWMFNGASTIIPTTTVGILVNASSTLADLFIDGDATTTNIDISGTTRLNTIYYTWPAADGNNGQVLKTDGSGTFSWQNDNTSAGGSGSNWMFSGPSTITPTSTVGVYMNSSTTIESTLSILGAATSTGDFIVGANAFSVKSGGIVEKGTWQGTAIADAYLTKSGDWTGTLDGHEGDALLSITTGTLGEIKDVATTTLANGSVLYWDAGGTSWYSIATTTWDTDTSYPSNWMFSGPSTLTPTSTIGVYLNSSTTIESTLLVLGATTSTDDFVVGANACIIKSDGIIEKGTWQGTAIADAYLTKTGDWTGTLDGIEGVAFLQNIIGATLGELKDVSTTSLSYGNILAWSADASAWNSTSSLDVDTATTTSLAVTHLVSCDTIDTDASGNLMCGSDATAAGGGGSNWKFPGNGLVDFITPTSTVGILVNASSTIMGDFTVGATSSSLFVDSGGYVSAVLGFVGSLTGNADTATALFGDPTDCTSGDEVADTIAASGNLSCTTISATHLTAEDFGEFTCNSAASGCTLDAESQGLTEMSDVTLDGPNDAEILVYQATPATAWIDVAMSGEATIDNTGAVSVVAMEGTDFGTLTDGQYCTYDQANTEIDCNSAGTAGSGGSNWAFSPTAVDSFITPTSTIGILVNASSTMATTTFAGAVNVRSAANTSYPFYVYNYLGTGAAYIYEEDDSDVYFTMKDKSDAAQVMLETEGNNYLMQNTGIGMNSPEYKLDITGATRMTGGLTVTASSTFVANLTVMGGVTSTDDFVVGDNACIIKAGGIIEKGTWQGTAIADAYLTKTGDWTGTLDSKEGNTYYSWMFTSDMDSVLVPTSTSVGITVNASSSFSGDFNVDGNATTTGDVAFGLDSATDVVGCLAMCDASGDAYTYCYTNGGVMECTATNVCDGAATSTVVIGQCK